MEEGGARPLLCTKFAALPWRLGRKAVTDAAKASLERLGVGYVDSYMIHWPGVWMNEEYAEGASSLTIWFRGQGTDRHAPAWCPLPKATSCTALHSSTQLYPAASLPCCRVCTGHVPVIPKTTARFSSEAPPQPVGVRRVAWGSAAPPRAPWR